MPHSLISDWSSYYVTSLLDASLAVEDCNNFHFVTVLDFFESDDQDSDLVPPQNVLHLESQQKWEVII